MTRPVDTLMAALGRLPAVTVQVDDAARSARVQVGAEPVARIDLGRGQVLVRAPADRIPTLRRLFPASRPASDGILFDLADPRATAEAVAAIRRRVIVQRSVPQLRMASP